MQRRAFTACVLLAGSCLAQPERVEQRTEFSADAGMRMFLAGGNAVDAGVAAMFAAAVTEYSRFASGAAPVMIRILANGMLEAGADPYGYRAARAW